MINPIFFNFERPTNFGCSVNLLFVAYNSVSSDKCFKMSVRKFRRLMYAMCSTDKLLNPRKFGKSVILQFINLMEVTSSQDQFSELSLILRLVDDYDLKTAIINSDTYHDRHVQCKQIYCCLN